MRLGVIWLSSTLVATASNTEAGLTSYTCRISASLEVGVDGRPGASAPWDSKEIGSSFSVDRTTGRISGNISFDTGSGESFVVAKGDEDGSFVAYGETGYPRNYVEIREFVLEAAKPFTMMDYGVVYMGTCL